MTNRSQQKTDQTILAFESVLPERDGTGCSFVRTSLSGRHLLAVPCLNKGQAFSNEERALFGLNGLIPDSITSLDQQQELAYECYLRKSSDLERYAYLLDLRDNNLTLFHRLLGGHIGELFPMIYTPVVGLASQQFSHLARLPRGLYISYQQRESIDAILSKVFTKDIRMIVATDGERVLGLGDQGVGGMSISVGKLELYTACAGIHPSATLPIVLDVGTDNQDLLSDPQYAGLKRSRVRGQDYDDFIESFVSQVNTIFPEAVLQWEDFAKNNARRLLVRYRDRLCTFNDDIQGTGAVALAGLMAASELTGIKLSEQRIAILGAGSAATGIAEMLVAGMVNEGCTLSQARASLWLIDSHGLVHESRAHLETDKLLYAQPFDKVASWSVADPSQITLAEVVHNSQPTVLIGTAAQPGAFSESIVREMAAYTERPIIFPLSNPTSKSEATPADILAWTEGRALVATGSPFPDVTIGSTTFRIPQCNNAFIFPGLGLGTIISQAKRVSDKMFVAAAAALQACSPSKVDPFAPLYPDFEEVREVSKQVAFAVASAAVLGGQAPPLSADEIRRRIEAGMWQPHYPRLLPR